MFQGRFRAILLQEEAGLQRVARYAEGSVDDIFGGDGIHDDVVAVGSQRGGLSGADAFTTVSGVNHIVETDSGAVWSELLTLLRGDPGSSSFENFPAYNPTGTPIAPKPCTTSSRMSSAALSPSSPVNPLSILPPAGTVVQPGDPVQVVLDLGGNPPSGGAVFTFGDQYNAIAGPGPYSFTFSAPSNRAGRIDIVGNAL